MAAFHGKPPGGAAEKMSRQTERLRPAIALQPAQIAKARRLRLGTEPDQIATALGVATDEVKDAGADAVASVHPISSRRPIR